MQYNIPTKAVGLNKEDVDNYVKKLVRSHDSALNELINKKRMLGRTKTSLLEELEQVRKNNVVYVEEKAEVSSIKSDAYSKKDVENTILLINEINEQGIEDMLARAKKQIAEYDTILEELEVEIDDTKSKIEGLLSDAVSVLKNDFEEVFSEKKPKDVRQSNIPSDNVLLFLPKKDGQGEDTKTKEGTMQNPFNSSVAQFKDYFEDVLGRGEGAGAVIILRINNLLIANYFLKTYDDNLIINAVDEKISLMGHNLKTSRLSYDTMGIVLKDEDDRETVENIAESILEQINRIVLDDENVEISANLGIALYPQDNRSAADIINSAGMALYKAREKGEGLYKFIDDELITEIIQDKGFKLDLHEAIENDELVLYYQPQFKAEDDILMGFEALLRWKNEKYNDMPILHVIQMAERENLISDMGYIILKKACVFARNVEKMSDRKIIVSVNFSNMQIDDDDFVKNISDIIEETGANPEYLGFEITESCFMECFNENCEKIRQIKDMGITISIDDFGTGYSTLSYLTKMPVSVVKIDKTFLDDMTISEKSANFIGSIINISHDLGLRVVAEGVETEKQRQMLRKMECDYLQGFYMAKPLPEEKAYMYI